MNKNKYNNAWCQNIAKFGAFAFCTAALLSAGVALASNIQFNELDADIVGDTVVVTGKLTGLGNKDIDITTTLTVVVDATCNPPGNSNKEPFGINKKLEVDQTQEIDAEEFKNGTVDFEFVFDLDFEDQVTCPNKNWTPSAVVVDVVEVSVLVEQRQGNDCAAATCDLSGSCVIEEC
jgi:hypothetical protein